MFKKMVCEICGASEATVHLTEIANDQVMKMHICQKCAKEKGAQMEANFGLADLLGGLADFGGLPGSAAKKESKPECRKCGMTYKDFKKSGKLGCDECYEALEGYLIPLMKRIHGVNQHVSQEYIKFKKAVSKDEKELQKLKTDLTRLIKAENFEQAAIIRDAIKNLEKKIKDKQ